MCDLQMPGVNTDTGGSPPTLLEVELQPWFMDHVKTSLVKADFSSLYFTVGIVEEAAELLEEKQGGREESVVSEVGDLCWYIYGLCNSLPSLTPTVSSVSPLTQTRLKLPKCCFSVGSWPARSRSGTEGIKAGTTSGRGSRKMCLICWGFSVNSLRSL